MAKFSVGDNVIVNSPWTGREDWVGVVEKDPDDYDIQYLVRFKDDMQLWCEERELQAVSVKDILNRLRKQHAELGKRIAQLEKEESWGLVRILAPYGCFDDFREGATVQFKLYAPSEEKYTFDEAQKAVAGTDRRLMTKEEVHLLIVAGILKEKEESFWTSSPVLSSRFSAWAFYSIYGYVTHVNRSIGRAIRCVGRCET